MKLRILLATACALAALGAVTGSATAATPSGPFAMHLQPHLPGGTSLEIKFSPEADFICGSSAITGTHVEGAKGYAAWKVEKMNFESCTDSTQVGIGPAPKISVVGTPMMQVVTGGQPPITRLILADLKFSVEYSGCLVTFAPTNGALIAATPGTSMTSEIFENSPLTLLTTSSTNCNFFKSKTGTFNARYDSPFPPLEA